MSQENRIYIWLIIILILATGFRYYRYIQIKNESETFLLEKDSLFSALKIKADSIFAELDSAEYVKSKIKLTPKVKININWADAEELTIIPGIGPKMAGRIVEYRKSNGNFQNTEDLIQVKGIGEKKLEKMKGWVEVK